MGCKHATKQGAWNSIRLAFIYVRVFWLMKDVWLSETFALNVGEELKRPCGQVVRALLLQQGDMLAFL